MRIETVGGKDEVKAQLNLMREVRTDEERKVHHDAQYITTFQLTHPPSFAFSQGVRKEALTKKYGDEGADKILRALGEGASEEARRQLQIDEVRIKGPLKPPNRHLTLTLTPSLCSLQSGENISSARQAQLDAIMARAAASDSVATSSSTPPSPLKSPHPDTTTSTITPATATRTSARLLESDDDDDELVVEDTSQVEEVRMDRGVRSTGN